MMMMQSLISSKPITALYNELDFSLQLISQAKRYGAYEEEDDDPHYNSNREDYGHVSRKQKQVLNKVSI